MCCANCGIGSCDDQAISARNRWLPFEIPAGKRDIDGESPDITAHRELQEEVGLSTNNLVELAQFITAQAL